MQPTNLVSFRTSLHSPLHSLHSPPCMASDWQPILQHRPPANHLGEHIIDTIIRLLFIGVGAEFSARGGLHGEYQVGQRETARVLCHDDLLVASMHPIRGPDNGVARGRAGHWRRSVIEALGGICRHKVHAPNKAGGLVAGQNQGVSRPDCEV